MSNFLLVDVNALGYAAHNTSKLTTPDGREVQAIFQTLSMLKTMRSRYEDYNRVLLLWDGHAQFRYDLYPEYKGKRDDTPEKEESRERYKDQVPILKSMLEHLGGCQITAPGFEADDLAGYFSRTLVDQGHKVKLITGDGDWKQLVNGRVSWSDPRVADRICNRVNFEMNTGFKTTSQFLEAKVLMGDTSDNIKGVPGIGEKAAVAIMRNYGSVYELFKAKKEHGEFSKDNLPDDLRRFKKKLNEFTTRDGLKIFKRNMALMDLSSADRDPEIKQAMVVNKPGKDFEAFLDICDDLSFNKMIRERESWRNLF